MDRNAIAALAKGLVPYVREVVGEAVTPLAARIDAIEARPIEKGERGDPGEKGAAGERGERGERGEGFDPETLTLPPELAKEVASAVRLLHEMPNKHEGAE